MKTLLTAAVLGLTTAGMVSAQTSTTTPDAATTMPPATGTTTSGTAPAVDSTATGTMPTTGTDATTAPATGTMPMPGTDATTAPATGTMPATGTDATTAPTTGTMPMPGTDPTTAPAAGTMPMTGTDATAAPAAATTAPAPSADMTAQQFVDQAAAGGMFEVQSSELALTQGQSDEVKTFAQKMIDDHTKANDELKALATSKGWTVPTTVSGPPADHMAAIEAAQGSGFDAAYMEHQAAAHADTIALFTAEASSSNDPDLAAWAKKTLPTLQMHADMLK